MSQSTKYQEGQRYIVTRDGARFEGLLLFGEQSMSGWSRKITKGETLTCLGWREVHVFGADIAGIMWTGLKVPTNAMVMQVWPFESLFRPFPLEGLLQRVLDIDDEDYVPPTEPAPTLAEIDEGHVVDLTNHLEPIARKPEPVESDEPVDLTHL